MKMYKVHSGCWITVETVLSQTEKTVIKEGGTREHKVTGWHEYFNDLGYAIDACQQKIEQAKTEENKRHAARIQHLNEQALKLQNFIQKGE